MECPRCRRSVPDGLLLVRTRRPREAAPPGDRHREEAPTPVAIEDPGAARAPVQLLLAPTNPCRAARPAKPPASHGLVRWPTSTPRSPFLRCWGRSRVPALT